MRKLGVWLALFAGMHLPAWGTESLVRVPITSKLELLQMLRSGMDVAYVEPEGKFVDIVADSGELVLLKFLGFSPLVAVPDLRTHGAGFLGASMGGYHTYAEVKVFLDSMAAARPDLVSPVFSAGPSLEGREIWGVKLSNLPNGNDGRPEVLYTALTHAREPASMEVLLYTIRYLLQNYGSDPLVTELLNTRDLYFVPVVNPDGYVYNQTTNPGGGGFWRKNRRPNANGSFGVDLNRNFGYQWGVDDIGSSPNPSSDVYRGTAPFSEPEAQRLRDFVLSRDFRVEIDYHTYSNLWLFPWGYTAEPAGDYWLYRAMADSAVQHNGYTPGPGWQLYLTNGTSIDWSYSAAPPGGRIYSFTPEVGGPSDGFWPPVSRIPVLAAENLIPNLFFAWVADNPPKILPPEPPSFLPADSLVADGIAELEWRQTDTGNPAAEYILKVSTGPQVVTDSVRNAGNWERVDFSAVPSPGDSSKNAFFSGAEPGSFSVMDTRNAYRVGPNDTLWAEVYYNLEPYFDYAYAEISIDGGRSFHPIAGGSSSADGSPFNRGGGITGSSGGWERTFFPLDSFAGQPVRFRFTYLTNLGPTSGGIYLRNIYPVFRFARDSLFSLPSETTYAYELDAPGEYYFSLAVVDSQGQTGRFSDWIKKDVLFSATFMDLNGDGVAAPPDIVLLLKYVFLGILPPHHPQRADANGDGNLSSADVVLFLNFTFLGQAP